MAVLVSDFADLLQIRIAQNPKGSKPAMPMLLSHDQLAADA